MSRHPELTPISSSMCHSPPARARCLPETGFLRRRLRLVGVLALVPPLIFLVPAAATAQVTQPAQAAEQALVASEVSVSAEEALLRLEFATGEILTVSLTGGRLVLDGNDVGPASPGQALDRAWREFLGRAISTEAEALPALLLGWRPPANLPPDQAESAELLADRIAAALNAVQIAPARSGSVRIHVDETLTIGTAETVPLPLVLFRSQTRVEGRIEGDVVVAGGTLDLAPGARVEGNVSWFGAQILGDRTSVTGSIEEIPGLADLLDEIETVDSAAAVSGVTEDLGDQIRREVRAATREAIASSSRGSGSRDSSALGRIGGGFVNLFRTLLSFAILLGAAMALVHFLPRRAEVIAETVRASMGRSVLVGLAGVVLAFPLWIVGIVLLAVSIIGIPVLALWIPAMPLAVATAILIGYLAVALVLGGRLWRGDARTFAGLDLTQPAGQIGIGLAALLGTFALAGVLGMGGPWFGVFQGVLLATGIALSGLAGCIGLGAVILSKAGQDTRFAGDAWGVAASGEATSVMAASRPVASGAVEGGGAQGDGGPEADG